MSHPYFMSVGQPSSGNHVIRGLVQAAGGNARIYHGTPGGGHQGTVRALEEGVKDVRFIMPIRTDTYAWHKSLDRKYGPGYILHHDQRDVTTADMRARILGLVEQYDVPLYCIAYEYIVACPERARRELLEWCGLPDTPWHEPIRDGNAMEMAR